MSSKTVSQIYVMPMRSVPDGSVGKDFCLQCGRPRIDPWVGKIT